MDNGAADGGVADVTRQMAEGVAVEDGLSDGVVDGARIRYYGSRGKTENTRREAWRGVAG